MRLSATDETLEPEVMTTICYKSLVDYSSRIKVFVSTSNCRPSARWCSSQPHTMAAWWTSPRTSYQTRVLNDHEIQDSPLIFGAKSDLFYAWSWSCKTLFPNQWSSDFVARRRVSTTSSSTGCRWGTSVNGRVVKELSSMKQFANFFELELNLVPIFLILFFIEVHWT